MSWQCRFDTIASNGRGGVKVGRRWGWPVRITDRGVVSYAPGDVVIRWLGAVVRFFR